MKTTLRVGLAQISPRLGDLWGNVEMHLDWIARGKAAGCDLLVFPEMSLCGYFVRDLAPDVALFRDSPVLRRLSEAAGEMDIVVGFCEEDQRHSFHISGAYLSQGDVVHVHRKVYLPTYGLFEDLRYFGAGERLAAFDTRHCRTGLLICEDLWHPTTAAVLSTDGADLLLAISSSPGRGIHVSADRLGSAESWTLLNRVYAQFFLCYLLYCNRVGFEDGISFSGGSSIVGPDGDILAQAPLFEEALLTAELDLTALRRERLKVPLLRDERLDLTLRELERIRRERS